MSKRKKRSFDTTEFSLSFSSIETLNQCPHKWYLRYIKQIYPKVKQDANDFGSFVHEVAENYDGGGIEEIKELCKILKPDFTFDMEVYKPKLKLAMKNLITFYKLHMKLSRKILREKEIRLPLNKIFDLTGKIDLLYNDKDGWVVVDYKSSKNKKDESKQLASYFFMLKCITKKSPKTLRAKIVYLCLEDEHDDPEEFIDEYLIDMEDYEMIDNVIKTSMRKINNLRSKNTEEWRKKCGPLCDYCDYKIANHCDGKEEKTIEQQLMEVSSNV